MADLRTVVESLGHEDVRTFIASGNVVFTSGKRVRPASLEAAIEKAFAIDIAVMLRSAADLKRVVADLPFPKADTTKMHVGFMQRPPPAATVAGLDHDPWLPEEF